jgi:hypothetical protein
LHLDRTDICCACLLLLFLSSPLLPLLLPAAAAFLCSASAAYFLFFLTGWIIFFTFPFACAWFDREGTLTLSGFLSFPLLSTPAVALPRSWHSIPACC